MTYLISYDLLSPGSNYSSLINAIQEYGSWAKISRSCWMVKTDCSAVQIRNELAKHIDRNDILFVCKTRTWAAQNIHQDVVDWLNN